MNSEHGITVCVCVSVYTYIIYIQSPFGPFELYAADGHTHSWYHNIENAIT